MENSDHSFKSQTLSREYGLLKTTSIEEELNDTIEEVEEFDKDEIKHDEPFVLV